MPCFSTPGENCYGQGHDACRGTRARDTRVARGTVPRAGRAGCPGPLDYARPDRECPYRVSIAIAVEQVSPARVRIVPYALGTATRVVPRASLFVCECDWCQDGTLVYTCICRQSIEGIVIAGGHRYLRRYPRAPGAQQVLALARRDWEQDPASFVQLL